MKFITPVKSLPFLIFFLIILLLSISNKKENIKLKLLIWNTPSTSLGTYIAISAGSGYILSYLFTNSLAKVSNNMKPNLNYKSDPKNVENNVNQDKNNQTSYDYTLIERDIKDPSPTISASFRIIGKASTKDQQINNIQYNEYDSSEYSDKTSYDNNSREINNNYANDEKLISSDWEDDTYKKW